MRGEAESQRNAQALGLTTEAAAYELERLDELRHALPHYLAAADQAKSGPLAVRALERANEALRLLAQSSDWASARAFESDVTALSRQLYARLRHAQLAAGSPRGNAVWWSFSPPAEKPWTPRLLHWPRPAMERLVLFSFVRRPADEKPDPYSQEPVNYGSWFEKLRLLGEHAGESSPARLIKSWKRCGAIFMPT